MTFKVFGTTAFLLKKKKRFVFLFKKMLPDPYFFEEARDFFY